MDGTKELPLVWDLSRDRSKDDVVTAARREIAYQNLLDAPPGSTGLPPRSADLIYAWGGKADTDDYNYYGATYVGPIEAKFLGVESRDIAGASVPYKAIVTFCIDPRGRIAWKEGVRLSGPQFPFPETFVMLNRQDVNGERRWLVDTKILGRFDHQYIQRMHKYGFGDRAERYVVDCQKAW